MEKSSKIYIAGHKGMMGSSIVRTLNSRGYNNIITRDREFCDLRNQRSVEKLFNEEKPEYVFLAAARAGDIFANNTYRAEFIYDNIQIQSNVIHQAFVSGIKKLVFFGGSSMYPKDAKQPLKEDSLLSGPLEKTIEPDAIAKITGVKLCENYREEYGCNFISIMPTNVYGINDHYEEGRSHVIPALLKRMHEAKLNDQPVVFVWGSGNARREFLYIDDMADAAIFLMLNYDQKELINIGTGKDIAIHELVLLIKEVVGYKGDIQFDTSKPDGSDRKLLDITKLTQLGWEYNTKLKEGIAHTYEDFLLRYN